MGPENCLFSGGLTMIYKRKYLWNETRHRQMETWYEMDRQFETTKGLVLHSSKFGELWPTNGCDLVAASDPLSQMKFTIFCDITQRLLNGINQASAV